MPGVEALMQEHQSIKVEVDAHEDSFQSVLRMGQALLAKNHYATAEVRWINTPYRPKKYQTFILYMLKV